MYNIHIFLIFAALFLFKLNTNKRSISIEMSDENNNDDIPEEVEAPDVVACVESYSKQENDLSQLDD